MQELSEKEIAYLNSQMLGRIATTGASGQPHVTPVGYRYNPDTGAVDVGGLDIASTRKARDLNENPRAAIVVDDLASINPWRPRGVIVRGPAELVVLDDAQPDGPFGSTIIRITPQRVISWGLETPVFTGR